MAKLLKVFLSAFPSVYVYGKTQHSPNLSRSGQYFMVQTEADKDYHFLEFTVNQNKGNQKIWYQEHNTDHVMKD